MSHATSVDISQTTPTQEEKRTHMRRRQIFEAASRVFAEKGYHQATVQDVAHEAGLGKGTLYGYVRSKQELLLLVVEEGQAIFHEETTREIAGISNPIEKLRAFCLLGLRFFDRHRSVSRALTPVVMGLDSEEMERIEHSKHGFVELCQNILDEAIEAGALRPVNTQALAELTLHHCWLWTYSHSLQKHFPDPESFEALMSDIFFNGAMAR